MDTDADVDGFMRWFQSSGGLLDTRAMGITEFPGSGRGAIALCDIPEGHTLFTLPRTVTLSMRTSPLPALFGLDAWRAHGLHKGWVGLILCMMWEDAWAHESEVTDVGGQSQVHVQAKWGPYMHTLPMTFDTPMFWSADELEELKGTSVVDKIGRGDAERVYVEQLVPAITTSSTLFPPSHHAKWYTLDAYHCAGSRILSRSFTVSRWSDDDEVDTCQGGEAGESDDNEFEAPHPETSIETSAHVNDAHRDIPPFDDTEKALDSDAEDDEEADYSDVAMVPMADLLNARWGSENAKLFYEPLVLRMVTTKNIKRGEQIFNTYGDPPNSDLLRRYGHVDLVRLPSTQSTSTVDALGDVEMGDSAEVVSHLGNPSDVVEIRADLVVHIVQTTNCVPKVNDVHARIDWWLNEGEDDTFVLALPEPGSYLTASLPSALVSLTRLLTLSNSDFKCAHSKGKLPKGKLKKGDTENNQKILEILDEVFKWREGMYVGGSIADDERLLSLLEALTQRKRFAVIVRLGEKRVINAIRQIIAAEILANGGGSGRVKDDTRRDKKGRDGGREKGDNKKRATSGAEGDHELKRARTSR